MAAAAGSADADVPSWVLEELEQDGSDGIPEAWRAISILRSRWRRNNRKSSSKRSGASAFAEEIDGLDEDAFFGAEGEWPVNMCDNEAEWLVQWRPPLSEAKAYETPQEAQFWMSVEELFDDGCGGVLDLEMGDFDDQVCEVVRSHGEDDTFRCVNGDCVAELLQQPPRISSSPEGRGGETDRDDEFRNGIPFWRVLHLFAAYESSPAHGGKARNQRNPFQSTFTNSQAELQAAEETRAREFLRLRETERTLLLSDKLEVIESLLRCLPLVATESRKEAIWNYDDPLCGEDLPPLTGAGEARLSLEPVRTVRVAGHDLSHIHPHPCTLLEISPSSRGSPGVMLTCPNTDGKVSLGSLLEISEDEILCECPNALAPQIPQSKQHLTSHEDILMVEVTLYELYVNDEPHSYSILYVHCPEQSGYKCGWVKLGGCPTGSVREMQRSPSSGDLLVLTAGDVLLYRQRDLLEAIIEGPDADKVSNLLRERVEVAPHWRVRLTKYRRPFLYGDRVLHHAFSQIRWCLNERALISRGDIVFSVDFANGSVGPAISTGIGTRGIDSFAVSGDRLIALGGGSLVISSLETRLVTVRLPSRWEGRPWLPEERGQPVALAAGGCFVVQHGPRAFRVYSHDGKVQAEHDQMQAHVCGRLATSDGRVLMRLEADGRPSNEFVVIGDGHHVPTKSAAFGRKR